MDQHGWFGRMRGQRLNYRYRRVLQAPAPKPRDPSLVCPTCVVPTVPVSGVGMRCPICRQVAK